MHVVVTNRNYIQGDWKVAQNLWYNSRAEHGKIKNMPVIDIKLLSSSFKSYLVLSLFLKCSILELYNFARHPVYINCQKKSQLMN